MFMWLVNCKSVYLIISGVKDHLGVPRKGLWAVSLCLTEMSLRITFSDGITWYKVSKVKFRKFSVTVKDFSELFHYKVNHKNLINCLSEFLCIPKVLNVVLILIHWYLNQKMHISNKFSFSWFLRIIPYLCVSTNYTFLCISKVIHRSTCF